MRMQLPFGPSSLSFNLPDDIRVEVIRPAAVKPAPNPLQAVASALDQPIGTPPLEALARPGQRVAVIVDDVTRPTPVALILPEVLRRLQRAGIHEQDISIVLALGTHRPMTRTEIAEHIGLRIARGFRVINANAFEPAELRDLGTSSLGVPIQISRHVVDADLRVAIGNIVPHSDAGWGGGAKIIYPGVAGAKTVEALHLKSATNGPAAFGSETTPAREDIEALVAEFGLDFIINTILTAEKRIYGVVAGHFVRAHRVGIALARRVYGIGLRAWPDAVIVNAYPTELDFWQASKALFSGARILRPGGQLLLLAPCPEALGPHAELGAYLQMPDVALQDVVTRGDPIQPIAAGGALQIATLRRMLRISIYSPGLDAGLIRAMRMLPAEDLEDAIASIAQVGRVAVITHGGETCPYIADG